VTGNTIHKRRPTQADVAQRAGVSQTTVSQVLNNKTVLAIPAETRQRIHDAVEALGYVPDGMARSLRTRKTSTIAGIIPDITNPFYPAFERGIQDVADQHGYDLLTYNTDGVAEKERKCLRLVQQGRVDGIIGVFFHTRADDIRPLLERNIAVVRLEAVKQETGDLPLDSLFVDNIAAARTAVEYLIDRGHIRIGMITGHMGPRHARVLGYRQALADHHIALDEILIQGGDFTEPGGYQGMRALLVMSPRPSAVFAANDLIAMGALIAIREAGLRVPQDIAVVGFDDIPAARLVYPALTTITQFQEQLGQRAAQLLLERLNGTAPERGRCEELPYELIVRESA
jgi:LacI family transcriptional regulator